MLSKKRRPLQFQLLGESINEEKTYKQLHLKIKDLEKLANNLKDACEGNFSLYNYAFHTSSEIITEKLGRLKTEVPLLITLLEEYQLGDDLSIDAELDALKKAFLLAESTMISQRPVFSPKVVFAPVLACLETALTPGSSINAMKELKCSALLKKRINELNDLVISLTYIDNIAATGQSMDLFFSETCPNRLDDPIFIANLSNKKLEFLVALEIFKTLKEDSENTSEDFINKTFSLLVMQRSFLELAYKQIADSLKNFPKSNDRLIARFQLDKYLKKLKAAFFDEAFLLPLQKIISEQHAPAVQSKKKSSSTSAGPLPESKIVKKGNQMLPMNMHGCESRKYRTFNNFDEDNSADVKGLSTSLTKLSDILFKWSQEDYKKSAKSLSFSSASERIKKYADKVNEEFKKFSPLFSKYLASLPPLRQVGPLDQEITAFLKACSEYKATITSTLESKGLSTTYADNLKCIDRVFETIVASRPHLYSVPPKSPPPPSPRFLPFARQDD